MINGEQDLKYSSSKPSKQGEKAKISGPQAMPCLSENVARIKAWRLTKSLHLVYQNPNPQELSARPKGSSEWLRSKISSMSNEYLAYLDKHGIKIIGLDW